MTHAVFYDYTLDGTDSVSNMIPESAYTDPDGDDMLEIQHCNAFLLNLATGVGKQDEIQYNKWDAFWNLTGDDLGEYSRFIYYVTYV